ncbi:hypothetical protein CHLNCDRAFT_145486 [Chlorella variabilis]|uniref:Uncharacterized protein n=1 Tax=Chlorella variabilis TaxID=554065 RepID=E1ZDL0_CHLVA|nr:hypothetical protein CHLNCDRAFT_145486 [Chlorella variabilis]EFN55879.1 hypothetical protein CHLNCDRAFT_145486 [Chlorella variabilis]|eukprot:XP_005847981.1 hypothetical protein CHLNCDRAFT_145486 [Chlorella variabilis]
MLPKHAAVLRTSGATSRPVSHSGSAPGSLGVECLPLLPGPAKACGAKEPRQATSAVAACVFLTLTYLAAYWISLMGGSHSRDLAFINAHLNLIARCLITAILAFTAAVWAARLLGPWAWRARGALAAAHLALLCYDHGQDFQAHGFYNWMLFLVVALPLNMLLLGLFLWYTSMRPRQFAASLLGTGAAAALAVALALLHYQHIAHRGFMGRSLNFWTGSQQCPPIRGFDATFSSAGLLTISGCPAGAATGYTRFPDTRMWSVEQKTHLGAAYQVNVLKLLKEEPYTAPVQLSGVEAVLARCGEQERLLTRIAAVRQRLPPEPPLALRPGAAGSDGGQGSGSSGGGTEEAGRPAGGAASGGQPERLNVLILFLDSLGRRHFFRRMPRSAAAVEAVARRGASSLHQFFRYHVTGFHTDPNTHVMYTGSPFENQRAQPFWHAYRQAGYVSGSVYNLCEDWGAEYDSMRTPHDHELVAPFCLPEYHPVTLDGEPYQMFKGAFSILRRCLRGRHVHQYNFDYSRAFMEAYQGVAPWLLISSFHEGHEGTGEVLGTVDADLAAFLLGLTDEQLNSTAVLLVSDHGMTMGINYMLTQNGRITEHKIPLLAMLLPAWVGERYPAQAAALAANEQRLVSGYDLHATLHHLLHLGESDVPPEQQYDSWRVAGNVAESVRWGVSLLAEVPAGRNCDEAGIPPDFCQCFAP